MTIEPTELRDVLLITPKAFPDQRGFFVETFSERRYAELGIAPTFVQDNHSHSRGGVLRGMHFQLKRPQGKLVGVIHGEILDVAVDVRVGSPDFGRWTARRLSATNHCQMYIPSGFAHGFCVLSESADVLYKCSDYFEPGDDGGFLWSDPDVGIPWPTTTPIVSAKDQVYPALRAIPHSRLPAYAP